MTDQELRINGSVISYPDGTLMASTDGKPIRVTVEGGGFTDEERFAIAEDLLAGRINPHSVPPGDGSKIIVTFDGGGPLGMQPHWTRPVISHAALDA